MRRETSTQRSHSILIPPLVNATEKSIWVLVYPGFRSKLRNNKSFDMSFFSQKNPFEWNTVLSSEKTSLQGFSFKTHVFWMKHWSSFFNFHSKGSFWMKKTSTQGLSFKAHMFWMKHWSSFFNFHSNEKCQSKVFIQNADALNETLSFIFQFSVKKILIGSAQGFHSVEFIQWKKLQYRTSHVHSKHIVLDENWPIICFIQKDRPFEWKTLNTSQTAFVQACKEGRHWEKKAWEGNQMLSSHCVWKEAGRVPLSKRGLLVTSLERFAFASCAPGQTPTDPRLAALLAPILFGSWELPALKYLIFEARGPDVSLQWSQAQSQ